MLELKVRVDTLTASGNMGSARDTCMRRTFVIRRTLPSFRYVNLTSQEIDESPANERPSEQ